ncbi:MAG: hypothetical protein FJ147_09820 [Deltaproteobacteria bacterium]|nr:hypothetical protein [Deltaproteobacteria bacterium]
MGDKKVFISHSTKDDLFVAELRQAADAPIPTTGNWGASWDCSTCEDGVRIFLLSSHSFLTDDQKN